MNQWLRSELLSSLTEEHWKSKDLSIPENHVWDVQLTVNGIECEPVLLGDLLHNIEAIIDRQAQSLSERVDILTRMGENGWELVSYTTPIESPKQPGYWCIDMVFKRKKK